MAWVYGTKITEDRGDRVVTVRDLPEVQTSGDTLEHALALAEDAIAAIVMHRIEHGAELPPPSPIGDGEYGVSIPAQLAAKASVYRLWKGAGISKSELARRMGVADNEAHRVLNPRHPTKLDALDRAARSLGARLRVSAA